MRVLLSTLVLGRKYREIYWCVYFFFFHQSLNVVNRVIVTRNLFFTAMLVGFKIPCT